MARTNWNPKRRPGHQFVVARSGLCSDCGYSCSAVALEHCQRPELHRARPRGPRERQRLVLGPNPPASAGVGNDYSDDNGANGIDGSEDTNECDDGTSAFGEDDDEDGVLDTMVTIGVVGHPNAGKSSLINGVFGRKVVSTSATPGHTKHLQTMFLSSHVRLCDCPGLTFPGRVPRELQVIAGMYPISQLREPYAVVKYIADRIPLVTILDLEIEIPKLTAEHEEPFPGPNGWTGWTICEAWAAKRGFRTAKAARLDVYRAANNILRLALDGRIVLATTPPGYIAPNAMSDECEEKSVNAKKQQLHATVLSTSTMQRVSPLQCDVICDEPLTGVDNDYVDREDDDDGETSEEDKGSCAGVVDGGMFALLGDS
jgi:50S ribosome-binding GTPase